MDDLDFWRLCDELSIFNAALLMSGQNPSGEKYRVEAWQIDERPQGYEAAKTALINGLKREIISGKLNYIFKYDKDYGEHINTGEVDLRTSFVSVESVKAFLRQKDFHDGFFVCEESNEPDYLTPENPSYAPKLAAAVRAWETVSSDESQLNGKTPKQALEKWLREHANEFGLTDADGNPVNGTIEQIAKVANWKPEGGAAKTPNLKVVQTNLTPHKKNNEKQSFDSILDEDIPF